MSELFPSDYVTGKVSLGHVGTLCMGHIGTLE